MRSVIRNPNDIVERLVADFQTVSGGRLLSVVMYGSAVSHEYRPGRSDINVLFVLDKISVAMLRDCTKTAARWKKRGVAPLLLPKYMLESLPGIFPVEFFDMHHNYRVLLGDDMLASLKLDKDKLMVQCRRELYGIAVHLRMEIMHGGGAPRRLDGILAASLRSQLPYFKAMLFVGGRKIPNTKAEIVAAVEEFCGLGSSVLSEIVNGASPGSAMVFDRCERFLEAVEAIDRYLFSE